MSLAWQHTSIILEIIEDNSVESWAGERPLTYPVPGSFKLIWLLMAIIYMLPRGTQSCNINSTCIDIIRRPCSSTDLQGTFMQLPQNRCVIISIDYLANSNCHWSDRKKLILFTMWIESKWAFHCAPVSEIIKLADNISYLQTPGQIKLWLPAPNNSI